MCNKTLQLVTFEVIGYLVHLGTDPMHVPRPTNRKYAFPVFPNLLAAREVDIDLYSMLARCPERVIELQKAIQAPHPRVVVFGDPPRVAFGRGSDHAGNAAPPPLDV